MRFSKIFLYLATFIIFLVLFFGIFISRYELQLRRDLSASPHPKFFDYRGVSHSLTSYSQGSAPPAEMIEHAAKANIDYLYITDLNDFDASHEIFGYNNDVLVFTGKKISLLDAHFLVYSKESLERMNSLGTAQTLINDFMNRMPSETEAETVFLAHPFKQGHEWSMDYPKGLNGIEVMNLRQMWQQTWLHKKASFLWSLFLYAFNPKIALLRLINEPTKEINLWDRLNLSHKTIGVLGNHSTGKIFSAGPISFSFPTYEDSFRFGSNHILMSGELTGVASRDLEKIHKAFTNGQFYFAIDALANPEGFAAYMKSAGREFMMGSIVPLSKNTTLYVDLPALNIKSFEIKVFKDGIELLRSTNQKSEFKITEAGNYRVYARLRLQLPIPGELRWIPWIYTNNFYVR
ncbi:hypothetical protein K2X05_14435 [bacterium]|nr:hypothetical protein [bacterium]